MIPCCADMYSVRFGLRSTVPLMYVWSYIVVETSTLSYSEILEKSCLNFNVVSRIQCMGGVPLLRVLTRWEKQRIMQTIFIGSS